MYRLASLAAKRGTRSAAVAAAAGTSRQGLPPQREMCGLVAAIDDIWTSKPRDANWHGNFPILADSTVMPKAANILYHRGPDGMQVSSGALGKYSQRWTMGHTRLAIVDPSNRMADMPFNMKFGNKSIHLAANGEIYNHKDLYGQIKAEGWQHERFSGSDCEVIGHAYAKYGGPVAASKLDGMFAFVIFEEDEVTGEVRAFAARDPVGIKPLYFGRSTSATTDDASAYVFASELKSLVGHVDPSTIVNVPAGHYWTPEEGLVCYYNPDWLRKDDYAPWTDPANDVTDDEIREAFTKAVKKRMMADVDYGFFLSGGVDSCIVSHDLLPLYREEGDDRPIKTFTVGMENSPDMMAAKGMVDALGGEKYVDHRIRTFTPEEVFDLIPKIVYHMETYEAELIRSAIPNWLLAERAAQDVKMVLTGEGADELFAGYLYFQDAETPAQVQNELRRIYGMLGNVNLHRTDRMTMAHGLEARVPFLDTEFTKLVMSLDPARKMVDPEAVKNNSRGREKTLLRELFEGPNANGHSIPRPVLWRAKAMQCEGVGEDWVSILQGKIAALVSDAEMAEAASTYPINTPHTKEELYYRKIYDEHYHGMEHAVNLWEGGGRAMGAEWKSDMYTREGLADVNLLSHALQQKRAYSTTTTTNPAGGIIANGSRLRSGVATMGLGRSTINSGGRRSFSTATVASDSASLQAVLEAQAAAFKAGFDEFESMMTTGGDDRTLILDAGTNKYHIKPQPIAEGDIFRGSCTGNPPTRRGYDAARSLYESKLQNLEGAELEAALTEVFADQRSRVASVLQLPEGTEVILVPSGSDAEYLPIAFAKALHPDKQVTNGVTQLREIGAGSAPAAVGKFFSTHAPLLGALKNKEVLQGFEGTDGVTIDARARSGNALDAVKEMNNFMDAALADGKFPIIHGVFGGKTGMRDAAMPGSLESGDKSLGVVDACQARFQLEELHGWLEQDSIVLYTGSKFYQAPPFCGAVLIPSKIAEKLRNAPAPTEMLGGQGLGAFFTDKELPPCLEHWKGHLKNADANNVGLALRWEAGLAGMEALSPTPDAERSSNMKEWSAAVSDMVNSESELDVFCLDSDIVSLRVSKGSDGWLNMSELRDIYRWMSMDVSSVVADATAEEKLAMAQIAYTGQPVDVADSHAIIRIAMGVDSMLSYLHDKEATLAEDKLTVKKLAALGKHFETLKNSGL